MKVTYKFKTSPDPHQRECLKRAIKKKKYGIFFEQRAGKTKVAIDYCGVLSLMKGITKVLIVSPLSVRTEWEDQIHDHLPLPDYTIIQYPKTAKTRQKVVNKTKNTNILTFMIINYDVLSNEKDRLLKWSPDVVIFDESHLLKNHNRKRSKAAYSIARKVEYRLLLTGTPIPKYIHDIFGQFKILNDKVFGTSWTKFKHSYCIMGGYMGKQIVNYQNKDDISRRMSRHSMRVLRKDVFDEPNVENVTLRVPLENKARRIYDELKKQYITELDAMSTVTADMAITRLMRLQQICGGWVKDDDGVMNRVSTTKNKYAVDLIKTKTQGNEPVVVFYRYTAEGNALAEALNKAKLRFALFNGNVSEEGRKQARYAFQAGKLDAILIQISTGTMGITLDRACTNLFYSLDFSLVNFMQARDRVMGRNQKHDVTNYFLVADKTVDEKIILVLKDDEDLARSVSDKWRWLMS